MKKVLALVMVCILALCAIACGAKTNEGTTNNGEGTTDEQTDSKWSKYPEKLEDWSMATLKDYLRAEGIIVDGDSSVMGIDMSTNELEATGLTAGFVYTNITDGSIVDMFMEARTDDLLNGLKNDHSIAGAIPMDGMLGNFAFSYSGGYNEEHLAALKKAIEDLGAHYGVAAELWN